MASQADIKRRMRAIAQTRQITRAMHMLSATKVRQDSRWIELTETYFFRVRATMRDILEKSKEVNHRFLTPPEGDNTAFIVIAGDKGLAGGYNHNLLKYALDTIEQHNSKELITVGQMTKSFFAGRGYDIYADYVGAGQRPYLHHARRMIGHAFELYDSGSIDRLYVIFTRYKSPIEQYPQCIKLMPIELYDYMDVEPEYKYSADILYEPSPQAVFDTLVPEYAVGMLFGAMVQSYLSEHSARMTAMESATHNADDILTDLGLEYNLARKYAVTREISEISGAAEALNKINEVQP